MNGSVATASAAVTIDQATPSPSKELKSLSKSSSKEANKDPEKADGGADEGDDPGKSGGMSQANKDDLGVCVVIILITVLAIIVTVIKIILFDIKNYPQLFGGGEEDAVTEGMLSSTTTEAGL